PYVPRKKRQQWDTKLMLGGGMALLLILVVGGVLTWNFMAVPAVEMFESAEKTYREQAYSDAKGRFEAFLESYPSDDNASKARVRIRLIQLRLDINDPERALTTAKTVLPEITAEADAEMGREEFPGILPEIPKGFIQRAKQAEDTVTREQLLEKAKQGLALVNDPEYITTSRRNPILGELTRINEDIGLIERTIVEEKELAKAITEIGEAEQAGDTARAFNRYLDLIRDYPRVRDEAGLKDAIAKVSQRERTLVALEEQPLAASPAAPPPPGQLRVLLAARTGGGATKPENPVVAVLANGSVYAVDGVSGQPLWTRYVGYETHCQPQRLSSQAGADILLVDQHSHELVRMKARTGEVVWRLTVGEALSDPTIAGARLYVATEQGRVLEIDAESGASQRQVKFPQKLTVPPAAAPDQPYVYQVGDQSHVYVLNANTLACEDVIYTGHRAGTIEVPPLLLMGHLFVAENFRADGCRIHVFKVRGAEENPKLVPTQAPLMATGRVVVPLTIYNRRLLALTDRGEIRVFDVDKSKNENSVTDTGKLPPSPKDTLRGYALADGTTLWIADNKLTKYTVQVARKEIVRDTNVTYVGDAFVGPLQLFGNQLVHTRRMAGSTGITIASVPVDNPRKQLWETHVGVPAGRVAVNAATGEVLVISSGAALYEINPEAVKKGYTDVPLMNAAAGGPASFTTPVELGGDMVALANPADNQRVLVYNPAAGAARLRIVTLAIGDAKVPCQPVAFQGGLLTPTDDGRVHVLKPLDGSSQILPFQPELSADDKIAWRTPAVLGTDGREFVIADNRKRVYRIGIAEQPSPHLAELASHSLEFNLEGGLAAAGDTVYGFVRAEAGDMIVGLSTSELKVVKEWDLGGGRVTWGPEAVGDAVLVVVNERQLHCFGPGQTQRWPQPASLPGQPAGRPLADDTHYVFAAVNGKVSRLAQSTGEESASSAVDEPLGAGPVAFRTRLLLCANSGSLYVIPAPTEPAGSGE
ncbi:MAG: PQQ-binding-like beta-propeller repeat protein, partial [Pirellulaceae bacterium]